MDALLITVVAAVFLGILAQVIAHRFKLPAILPLLLLGMGFGPSAIGLLEPSSLGHGLEVVLHLGVAVILFEGGLSLDLRQLRQVGPSLGNLLSIGMIVTWLGAAVLAHYITGVSWPTAMLFGAIVTVTGPTVISPLLRHMVAPKPVRTLLMSEGLMIDPIGAVLAYLVLQWIEHTDVGILGLAGDMVVLTIVGSLSGIVAGFLAVQSVKRRFLSDELKNLVILALLFGSFVLAEYFAETSGILASVVMGLMVSYAELPDLSPLKAFKGQLTVLFISVLFILLSGQLDLGAMRALGWQGGLVVAGLIFLVRPLSVLISVVPSALDWKEKSLLALTAPRGIVAAAVASLSAIQLRSSGAFEDAKMLEGLVYLVILVTCTWATIMAGWLPRALGYYGDSSRRRLVLVSANGLSLALARLFDELGWTVVVVDSARSKLKNLGEGIIGIREDARDASAFERAGVERDCEVWALTPNDELNLLIAELVRDEFGVEHPTVTLQRTSEEFGTLRRAWLDLLADRDLDWPVWTRRLEEGRASLRTIDSVTDGPTLQRLLELVGRQADHIVPLFAWREERPQTGIDLAEPSRYDRYTLLVTGRGADEVGALIGSGSVAAGPEQVDGRMDGPGKEAEGFGDGAPADDSEE